MKDIDSETMFILRMIFYILITPITLILVIFRVRRWDDLLEPFRVLFEFIFEPKLTITLILANIIVFFASIFFMNDAGITKFINYPQDLLDFRFYTLITAGFFHANLLHLFSNMAALFIFGRVVERRLGFGKTLTVYFGALVISSLISSFIHLVILKDNIGGLGASGAIMGLVATAILLDPFYLNYSLIIPIPIMILGWTAIYADISGILNPIEDGIGHFAHIGGFISIALLMYFFGTEEKTKMKWGMIINILTLILVGLGYFAITYW